MKLNFILVFLLIFQISSCKKGEIPSGLTTDSVELIGNKLVVKATIGKTGSSKKNSTKYGVIYGTEPISSINYQLFENNNTSRFTSEKNLTFSDKFVFFSPDKLYYIRSFAENKDGVAFGNEITFKTPLPTPIYFNPNIAYNTVTDNEGTVYKTITIGTQTWMAENIKTKHFNDNSLIPVKNCPAPDYNENLVDTYGRLYTTDVIQNTAGVCPAGWHVPTIEEWGVLLDTINNNYDSIKEKTDYHWVGNSYATNATGFTAIPSGRIRNDKPENIRSVGEWWSQTPTYSSNPSIFYYLDLYQNSHKILHVGEGFAFSIRCIKD